MSNNLNEQVDFTNGTSTNVPLNFPKSQIYYQTPAANTASGPQVSDQSIGIGSIIAHSSNVIPAGYLLCNGSTFDPTQFPLLYTALGNSNTLPDMRGMFARGLDTSGNIDRDGATRQLLQFQEGSRLIQEFNNNVNNFYVAGDYTPTNPDSMTNLGWDPRANPNQVYNYHTGDNDGSPNTTALATQRGWDMVGIARPKNVAVNYIIKAAYVGSVVSSASLANYLSLNGGNISGSLSVNGNPIPQILNTANNTGNPIIQSFTFSIGSGGWHQVTFPQAFLPGTIPQVWIQTCDETPNGLGRTSVLNITANSSTGTTPAITNTGFVYADVVLGGGGAYSSGMAVTSQILAIGYM